MVSFRDVMIVCAASATVLATATVANAGWCGEVYGCGPGNYGYGYSSGVSWFGPGYAAHEYYPAPRRYYVNQGPTYTGPNVSFFFPPIYQPGFVNTSAYPYIGRRAGWGHVRRHHHRHPVRYGYSR
jgi:hypothetical protein